MESRAQNPEHTGLGAQNPELGFLRESRAPNSKLTGMGRLRILNGFLAESRAQDLTGLVAQNPELTGLGLGRLRILNSLVFWRIPGLKILNSRAWGTQNAELTSFLLESRAQNPEFSGLRGFIILNSRVFWRSPELKLLNSQARGGSES